MFARILYLILALLLATPAWAQNVTVVGPVTPGNCAQFNSNTVIKDAGAACGGGGGAVSSVTNSDGTLTFSPTTGPVVGSINLGHANTWTAVQAISNAALNLTGTSTVQFGGTTILSSSGNYTNLFPPSPQGTVRFFLGSTADPTIYSEANGVCFLSPTLATNTMCFANNTANMTIGATGVQPGTISFFNATSGVLSINPPTGALGTLTQTLQAVTDTFVYRASSDSLTNKTIQSSTNILGGVQTILGSDANGDVYYRAGGVLTRLGIGTSGQVLTVVSGAPAWVTGGGTVSWTPNGTGGVTQTSSQAFQRWISGTDYGMGTGNTAAANATALTNACAQAQTVYIPAGTYNIQSPTLTGCSHIYGDGAGKTILVAAGSPVTAVLNFNGNATVIVENLEVDVSVASFPTINGIECQTVTYCTIRKTTVNGGNISLNCISVTNCLIIDNYVINYGATAIVMSGGTWNRAQGNNISTTISSTGAGMGCNTSAATCELIGNYAIGNPASFNYSVQDSQNILIQSNISLNSAHEGISVGASSVNVAHVKIIDNFIAWPATPASTDFGISLAGPANCSVSLSQAEVRGNTIDTPAKEGVALAGCIQYSQVQNNLIKSPNSANTGVCGGAVVMYDPATNNVTANNFLNDTVGHMLYAACENNHGGGNPNNNTLGPDWGSHGSNNSYLQVGANTQIVDIENAWVAFTPTIVCNTGAVAGYTAQLGHYKIQGKTVHVGVNVLASGAGTCTFPIQMVLPFTASGAETYIMAGLDASANVAMSLITVSNSANAQWKRYDGTNPAAVTDVFDYSGVYQRN
ncbi:MAG TPA: hypothetical protein VF748_17450 [Candidatus Acidoferrum sp.]